MCVFDYDFVWQCVCVDCWWVVGCVFDVVCFVCVYGVGWYCVCYFCVVYVV